ncbi:SDR family oxidoreductase [Pseudomonas schmalbachii]|uniref:SDR family oxidoreductase n=1 Tax=Pseudomonas schmalbachii TaxID=2816993 RepID=A0ABS3TJ75_9PSED|nr:SDR family oxidoreductase [Pseudomonas schmalbachii]MBO3273701.1 SDR family oxidoreductase [Pseudomonas schmalbachii]
MKIVVIGGTGLIGTQLCNNLRERGHEVLAASPNTGVNSVTGEGLREALEGADVVVDVANSPSFEDAAALEFFEKSGRNIFAAEKAAGVRHHVALSVVGTERMLESGYFRAKMAQEKLIEEAGVPYSILRATQFFEFIGAIAHSGAEGDTVRLTTAALQPIASADVAAALAKIAEGSPTNQITEVAGPDREPLVSFVRTFLEFNGDRREVIADDQATYFGARIDDQSLTPGADPILGAIHFDNWLKSGAAKR